MQIHELAALSGNPASGNVLAIDTGSVTRKIDYTALAKAIVEQYNGSTLAGSVQTVQAAINALNTSIGETAESIDTQAINQSYGALFPDTFWKKLTLINADVNNNDANNGALRPDRPYHIATESVLHFDHALTVSTTDATLQVADRIYAEDGTFISTNNWKRSITIPANAYFRLVFRAQPDDQSVTLDITTSMAKVTFEIASGLDAKVAISQGVENAGKALIVGDDGNVTLGEAGIADEVKTALLNLLQHVVYTDDQGQVHYGALKRALGMSDRNPNLPAEYEQVEYIRATGTQYIQTDILTQIPFRVVCDGNVQGTTQPTMVGGGISSVAASRFFMIANPFSNGANWIGNRFANDNVTWTEDGNTYTSGWLMIRSMPFNKNTRYTIESIIEYSQSAGKVDMSIACNGYISSATRDAPSVGYPIYLFYQSNADTPTEGTLYSCQFYAGLNLVFDAVPCYRKSDNAAGIYDVVGKKFYTNVGTGTFEVGEIIE